MKRLFHILFLLPFSMFAFGQDIPKHEADSLTSSLSISRSDNALMEALFRLAQYHMFKPGELAADLDSASTCIDRATDLNSKIKSPDYKGFIILLRSLLAREKGQIKEGKSLAGEAVALLRNTKYPYYLGKAYFALSEYFDYDQPDENTQKIHLVEQAYSAYKQSSNIERQAFTLAFLADLYQLNGERDRAIRKLDTALVLYNSIQHKRLQGIYIQYATNYYQEHLSKQALKYGLLALKTAESTGDSSLTLCQINNILGIIFSESKEYKKAQYYFLQAFKVAEKYNDRNSALSLMTNIVYNYNELNDPLRSLSFMKAFPEKLLFTKTDFEYIYTDLAYLGTYTRLKDFDKARPYASELIEMIDVHQPDTRNLNNIYHTLIKYYLDSRQYTAAAIYIRKAELSASNDKNLIRNRANFFLKFRLDTALGNYKSAVVNLLEYRELTDSLSNEKSSRQIKQLEIEYETEKNKNEIALLNEKNLLTETKLDREKLIRNFTIGGIILLLIIVCLLYRQYRHKQKNNHLIVQKNEQLQHFLTEKEWLVKEIHHRVKNNFHIVSSLLDIQSSYLKNKEALSAIKESQHRIHSMSIIHQKLYQSDTLSEIHMPDYIYELVEYLRDSYGIRERIAFTLQIDNIELAHPSAITLGLMLNEAITNSIKYAFEKTECPMISISLGHFGISQILLSIADNGRGLPEKFETRIGSTMGMELLQGLTADLGGCFNIETINGTHIKVIFDCKPIAVPSVSFA